ncbi:acyl-CoA N-acyltransferase [Penicillium malachiteum]|uniref:acyl-CoA N-acyltransferase n=1 Tax=Penicillium malachiteum TaxID=1324776 RepID=UPI0025489210|nr:acyl-CoA N-acyltransferase [Penicillium malachiteum]KAJ5725122.1 acyl-CoA N-acyltransferase [Penicillium malachiteum]
MSAGEFYYEQKILENDLISLVPFDQDIHTSKLVHEVKTHDLLKFIPFPKFESNEEFIKSFWAPVRDAPGECLYAIIDKATARVSGESDAYAGTMALTATSKENAATEIGIMIFPAFQRTHVATNAVGLLLKYTLDPPPAGGLGLRRVEWKCHSENAGSRRAALRMGFEFEGIARWHRAFTLGDSAEELEKRNGTKGELRGRHTAIFAITWDEWDEKRPKVVALMERKH